MNKKTKYVMPKTSKSEPDPMIELLKRGQQIRDTFQQRKPELAADAQRDADEFISDAAAEYNLPESVVEQWLSRTDGSTLPELSAKNRSVNRTV